MKEKFQNARNNLLYTWKKWHLTQWILLLMLLILLAIILYFAILASQANVQTLKEGLAQATVIYDKDGDKATEIQTNRNKGIKLDTLPDYVAQAVVAIEDHRFYEHNGFDIKGITRAFFKNVFAGQITGGGSTLTQQLTKNALLSPEKTYKRKIEELFLAVEMEKKYTKNEILEMYINQVYFGHGAWGIEQAAQAYFNKPAAELTISESALIAGLLQSPSALDPFSHYEAAIERRNVVLSEMKENAFITNKQYKAAKKEDILLEEGGGSFIKRDYAYYTDAVLDEAISRYSLTQEEILTRGYRIYTELDQNMQAALEDVYANDSIFPRGRKDAIVQSGGVLIDPQTGGVRALIGGRGESVFRGFNRATHLQAQPGSTLKPLAVYTSALEQDYTPYSLVKDEEANFDGYAPQNASHTYAGDVPIYQALEQSLNVPAVWLLNDIGIEKGLEKLTKFAIPLDQEDEHLAIALGGMHKGTSPLRLAAAYTVFANKGKRVDDHFITRIEGPTGNVIAERKSKTTKVTSKKVAEQMTSMLLNVVETGTGKEAAVNGYQIAGKTGSTQVDLQGVNGTKDQWFVGYTPHIVGAIWIGYDHTDETHYLSGSSGETVAPIFREVMTATLPYTKATGFDIPSINAELTGESYPETAKKVITEKAAELEQVIEEERDRFAPVLVKMKEELQSLTDLLKQKLQEIKP